MDISGFLGGEEAEEFNSTPIPKGEKVAFRIEEAELRDTLSGGKRLSFKLKVAQEEHKGRTIFLGLNIYNPNSEKNQAISLRDYRILCEACGFEGKQNNPLSLVNKCFMATILRHSEPNEKGYINEEIGRFEGTPEGFVPVVKAPGASRAAHHTAAYDDDDIPF